MRITLGPIVVAAIAAVALSACASGGGSGGATPPATVTPTGVAGSPSAGTAATADDAQAATATAVAGGSLEGEADDDDNDQPANGAGLPAGTTVMRDIAYGSDPAQRMDVYLPPHPAGPVIFMVHGGGWRTGDKDASRVVTNKAAHWLPRGVIFISTNYRLLPAANPLEQANDVAQALAFAQSQAAAWGGDPARFVLMGHSAGAHLVSLLTADPTIATSRGAQPWLGTVSLDSATFDVVATMQAPHLRLYDAAFGSDPNFWREASPLYRLAGQTAPMLIVCSSLRSDSCPQGRAYAAKAATLGDAVTVLPEALTHAEINGNLGLASAYTDAVDGFLRTLGILPPQPPG